MRDCAPVSPYALILFAGVLKGDGVVCRPPPPVQHMQPLKGKKGKAKRAVRSYQPPPPPPDGVLVVDGWIRFQLPQPEQLLLFEVRRQLDELLRAKIETPMLRLHDARGELLKAVSKMLSCN